jgi:hypothetical protein
MGPRVKQDGQRRVLDFSAGCLGVDDPNGLSCLLLESIVIRMNFFHLCLMFSHISYLLRSISRTLTMKILTQSLRQVELEYLYRTYYLEAHA